MHNRSTVHIFHGNKLLRYVPQSSAQSISRFAIALKLFPDNRKLEDGCFVVCCMQLLVVVCDMFIRIAVIIKTKT